MNDDHDEDTREDDREPHRCRECDRRVYYSGLCNDCDRPHRASPTDTSPLQVEYVVECGWCYLGAPHTTAAHDVKINEGGVS